jgi:uncharacterized membrane protein
MRATKWVLLSAVGGIAIATTVFVLRRGRRAWKQMGPVTASVTVNKPPREVYELFRDFSRLPEFMTYLDRVDETGTESEWTATLPVLGHVSWKARIVDDVPGKVVAWESTEGRIRVSGRVTFTRAPGRDATEVRAELELGGYGVTPRSQLARVFAAPAVKGDLRRFKQLIETGEVLRSDASAHRKPHPAQPSADAMPAPDVFIPHVANVEKGAVS